ncbi:hypothetical protein [Terribacillus saccharophilus]|nr:MULTISPECIES: hypothetical protein [Terribacillus]
MAVIMLPSITAASLFGRSHFCQRAIGIRIKSIACFLHGVKNSIGIQ